MPQSYASINLHVVFSTKNREPRIPRDLQSRLYAYLGGIAKHHGCCLLAAGGMPDHVHLLLSLSRTLTVAELTRELKASSSSWLHREIGRREISWQDGYGAFSISHSNLDSVKQYVETQEEHHRRLSFQDEFRELLRRHEIPWDEQYIWT